MKHSPHIMLCTLLVVRGRVAVLGGALAFGFIGVFLGPTLLAVGFRMLEEWFSSSRREAEELTGRREVRSG